ncbi:SGNH/GDSL hydrolase family protein [Sulfitobacter sp. M57]|uniref:SGNH/GDSL hydrolase family protein n=1 Tax=unclassified Sulfitobacter TaxID=196795 RepID=UPI0023E2D50E|nr:MULTISPECIES: SGNH/GDSL hydrolase family protein [unclassified Sulfitobacter]MDF3415663.1 SGNH/GDSL hydrolase family protein [Sulfitobacter sp. KE5]MDF3423143.1 SGNH/GDSL hydrolase family protein [Sulfitobacter sp. KE43]MDF3434209.1 SGNH/GDSL hydrolase family protein [Sulfitobacter sp. KE42]MDF3459758.1 SGNH/GDSL hydrolase family protein [Sulfitobacter sp. S74]MDF3463747.1 SGNH/GDSL hydrolase family protein [Sulfitobacter sp. Ks18]
MFDTVARAALSPLLIAQALHVRRSAQSLPEAAGPRSGTAGTGPALRLAIIGDSSAAGVGVTNQDNALSGQLVQQLAQNFTVSWHLDALTGATTRSTLARLAEAPARPFDVIVTALGVNDVTRLIPAKSWVRQQRGLFDRLNTLYHPKQIYISGMPPMAHFPLLPHPLRWTLGRHADKLERQRATYLATRQDCTHMPFDLPLDPALVASDGFHPAAPLYTLWAKEIASRILSDWPQFNLKRTA